MRARTSLGRAIDRLVLRTVGVATVLALLVANSQFALIGGAA
ncbi:hypothetical protein [Streptomyces chattanoogensis]|nr:hypothetical protein [Streptomyces chattanoogensis]